MCGLIGIMLKLYCSYICLLIYVCYSIPYKMMFLVLLFCHTVWKNFVSVKKCSSRTQPINKLFCFFVLIVFICLVAELLLLFPVVQLWCFMVKKGLRMKCVMLFPKYNVRNKISTHTNFSYITWYYNSTVAATNKKAYFGEYLLQVFI